MNNSYRTYTIIAALIIILGGGVWWTKGNSSQTPSPALPPVSETATSSESFAPTQEVVQQKPKPTTEAVKTFTQPFTFALARGETVASWNFVGPYKDGGVLEAKARAAIEQSKGLLNSGTFTNYELYVGIANQYNLLGDGKQEFDYLNKALAIDSTKTGLAWRNMGKLLERLGAYKSARVAYDRMVSAQDIPEYMYTRLEFLKAHMPEDTTAIHDAEVALGASASPTP